MATYIGILSKEVMNKRNLESSLRRNTIKDKIFSMAVNVKKTVDR
jgi:hypothetical protein